MCQALLIAPSRDLAQQINQIILGSIDESGITSHPILHGSFKDQMFKLFQLLPDTIEIVPVPLRKNNFTG